MPVMMRGVEVAIQTIVIVDVVIAERAETSEDRNQIAAAVDAGTVAVAAMRDTDRTTESVLVTAVVETDIHPTPAVVAVVAVAVVAERHTRVAVIEAVDPADTDSIAAAVVAVAAVDNRTRTVTAVVVMMAAAGDGVAIVDKRHSIASGYVTRMAATSVDVGTDFDVGIAVELAAVENEQTPEHSV
jgi:hypothetical protein